MNSSPETDSTPTAGEPRQWPWKLLVLLALVVATVVLLWVMWLEPGALVAADGDLIEQGAAPAAPVGGAAPAPSGSL